MENSGMAGQDGLMAIVLLGFGLSFLLAYLAGSIPSGLLLSRLFGLGDPRQRGSGNIGATNVLRSGHKAAAALTLLADALKGALPVLIAWRLAGPLAGQIAALGAFIGHCWPIWLGFRGGKGMATFLGVVLALNWPVGLAACATWALTAWRMRISSLAALAAAALSPLYALSSAHPAQAGLMGLLAALIFWRHQANIRRLGAGTEPRIGAA